MSAGVLFKWTKFSNNVCLCGCVQAVFKTPRVRWQLAWATWGTTFTSYSAARGPYRSAASMVRLDTVWGGRVRVSTAASACTFACVFQRRMIGLSGLDCHDWNVWTVTCRCWPMRTALACCCRSGRHDAGNMHSMAATNRGCATTIFLHRRRGAAVRPKCTLKSASHANHNEEPRRLWLYQDKALSGV